MILRTDVSSHIGYISGPRIHDYYRSYRESNFPSEELYQGVYGWVSGSMDWTVSQTINPSSTYWETVSLTVAQLSSIVEGYNVAMPQHPLSLSELWMLNSIGDMDDLIPAVNYTQQKKGPKAHLVREMCDEPWCIMAAESRSHCSAIVKPVNGELFAAHEMWASYLQMLMVWKEYDLGLNGRHIRSRRVAFSSWPGMVSSEDDFYITGANLVVLETTNNVYNYTLYDRLHPRTILSWVRAVTANYLAGTPDVWHRIMREHNSGTYNNQWMVIDMKKPFADAANKTLRAGTLVIGSQLPGFYQHQDVTPHINEFGYWPSYNVPYLKDAWVLAGYEEMAKMHGNSFTWQMAPRAQVFRQREGSATDMASLKTLMRYNDFQHDPIAKGCPMNQLASRGDLTPKGLAGCYRNAFGAVNGKITSSTRVHNYEADIVAGPTHDTQPVFSWTPEIEAEFPIAHYGQPKSWNFDWQTVQATN